MGKIHDRFKSGATRNAAMQRLLKKGEVQRQSFEMPPVRPGKGEKDGLCNRTACQIPGAYYFNEGSRAYYCWECALEINRLALPDGGRLFPGLKADKREPWAEDPRMLAFQQRRADNFMGWNR